MTDDIYKAQKVHTKDTIGGSILSVDRIARTNSTVDVLVVGLTRDSQYEAIEHLPSDMAEAEVQERFDQLFKTLNDAEEEALLKHITSAAAKKMETHFNQMALDALRGTYKVNRRPKEDPAQAQEIWGMFG